MNREAHGLLEQAIAAGPRSDAIDDLRFLKTLLSVYQPFIDSLSAFHDENLTAALPLARQARQMAEREFPTPIDPVGGEIGSLLRLSKQLEQTIRERR